MKEFTISSVLVSSMRIARANRHSLIVNVRSQYTVKVVVMALTEVNKDNRRQALLKGYSNGDNSIRIARRECNGIPGLGLSVALDIPNVREPDVRDSPLHGPADRAAHRSVARI